VSSWLLVMNSPKRWYVAKKPLRVAAPSYGGS